MLTSAWRSSSRQPAAAHRTRSAASVIALSVICTVEWHVEDRMDTVIDTAAAVRRRDISAAEALAASRRAVEAPNDALDAFVFLDWAAAEATAQAIDRTIAAGDDPGPVAGVPFGVKDLEDCAGMPTSHGSLIYKDSPPKSAD